MTFLLQLANQQLTENNVWQQRISVFLLLYLLLLLFPDYLSACPLSFSSFWKILKKCNIRWVLENIFWNTSWKLGRNVGNFETFLSYFEIILWNCLEYFHEISWKLQRNVRKVNFGLILEKLWRNIGVTLNY